MDEGRGCEGGDDRRLLRLSASDNVAVAIGPIGRGERVRVGGREVEAGATLTLGHKIACRDIGVGEKVIKYGVPIGSATAPIRAGEHVHAHNLRSDVVPASVPELDRAPGAGGGAGGEGAR